MIRLKTLTLSGFRGARFKVPLDFTPKARSMAIFGENATGKSSFADALEWFCYDRVDFLWKEDCKEEALRNVAITDTDNSAVSVNFTNDTLSCERVLTPTLKIQDSNTSAEFRTFKQQLANERIILRNSDLIEFIKQPKGKKREELAAIIGFQALNDFRSTILSILNHLEKHSDYLGAKTSKEQAQARLLAAAGSILDSVQKLHKRANELIKPFNIKTEITDDASYSRAIKDLTAKIREQNIAVKRLQLIEIKTLASNLIKRLEEEKYFENGFFEKYQKLLKNKAKLKLLDIEQFLSKGKEVLERHGAELKSKCPFCGATADFDHLKAEVITRIKGLRAIKQEIDALSPQKDDLISAVNNIRRLSGDLEAKKDQIDLGGELSQSLSELKNLCKGFPSEIATAFSQYREAKTPGGWDEVINKPTKLLRKAITKVEGEIEALTLTKNEEKIFATIQTLNDLKSAFSDYKSNRQIQIVFERQIKTIAKIKDEFLACQKGEFKNALDIMSEDINTYYLFLHPPEDENVKALKLRIVGEEGIEFEYIFHGKPVHPPIKYLSESHLNSIGIALFLASVKRFNKNSQYFVLDDVVTSFDSAHRRRLLRLLDEHFSDWQIVLLTHEHLWFELIKKELAPSGWIMNEVQWTLDNGIQLTSSPGSLRDLIELKKSKKFDVSNDLRTLSESILKEICINLGIKLAFRYNANNEDRMTGELLSELRRTLKEKNTGLETHAIFKRIEASALVATKGSHHSSLKGGSGDIEVVLKDLDDLENIFKCSKGHYIAREHKVPGEDKIACRCGERVLSWDS